MKNESVVVLYVHKLLCLLLRYVVFWRLASAAAVSSTATFAWICGPTCPFRSKAKTE